MTEPALPAALMAAVVAHPADDAPRLVAADWFAEHGDAERAELITLQCQLARAGAAPQLAARATQLELAARRRWGPDLAELTLGLERGFPVSALGDAEALADAAPRLAADFPLLSTLRLARLDRSAGLRRLLDSPLWPRVRTLSVFSPLEPALAELLGSGALGQLTALHLGEARLSDLAWSMLPTAGLHYLESLRLSTCNAAYWIRHGAALPTLRTLDLEWCSVRAVDLEALARTTCWPGLEQLTLDWNRFGHGGVHALAAAPPRGLRTLSLEHCSLRAAGVKALAEADRLALRALSLRGLTETGPGVPSALVEREALAPLVDAACLRAVERLDVRGVTIAPDVLERLQQRFGAALLAG